VADLPRRCCLYLFTPAEAAIRDAVQVVEAAGCDVRLTKAVMLLTDAQAWVADFVDGVAPEDHYPRPTLAERIRTPEFKAAVAVHRARLDAEELAEKAESRASALEEALRGLEWAAHTRNGRACPSCYGLQHGTEDVWESGHKKGCRLAALLAASGTGGGTR
jgi:hypothetical protein